MPAAYIDVYDPSEFTDNIFLILLHEKNIKCVNFPQQTQTSSLY